MERPALFALLACCAAIAGCDGGCETSNVDPDAPVEIRGRVLGDGGLAAGGVPLRLTKRPDAGEVVGGLGVALATAGLACVADDAPSFCADAKLESTTDDGRYSYALKGSDTQGSVKNADDLDLVAGPTEQDGPSTQATFRVQRTTVALPALRLWGARPSARVVGRRVEASWSALPSGFVPQASGRRSSLLFDAGRGRTIWTVAHARSPQPVDARVLEDAGRGVSVVAETEATRAGTPVALAYDGGRGPVDADLAGVPLSRGAPCVGTGRRALRRGGAPCWLTDGVLDRTGVDDPGPRRIAIDLGRREPVSLVVVRGCSGPCTLTGSRDGRRFRRLATVSGGDAAVPARGRSLRYVAITSVGPMSELRELSAWVDGVPGTASSGSADDPRSSSSSGGDVPGTHGGHRIVEQLALWVGLLLVVPAVAAAYRYRDGGRRRSPALLGASSVASVVFGVLLVLTGGSTVVTVAVLGAIIAFFDGDDGGAVATAFALGGLAIAAGVTSIATARRPRRRAADDDGPTSGPGVAGGRSTPDAGPRRAGPCGRTDGRAEGPDGRQD